ncbi:hypothetical protein Ciccas_012396 [Cichlidogyrus casuarinus]|uniref:Uncharacterized protein n=1 Tax=Cichlidogyrus casuarinus TaxID=1844966 RepID=A0ABD2PNI5_9PLAT
MKTHLMLLLPLSALGSLFASCKILNSFMKENDKIWSVNLERMEAKKQPVALAAIGRAAGSNTAGSNEMTHEFNIEGELEDPRNTPHNAYKRFNSRFNSLAKQRRIYGYRQI